MEKAATDIYTFENLRARGSQFFIALSRRFGKRTPDAAVCRCVLAGLALCAFPALADNSRLVAHRGDASRFPQNTLEAIKSAVEHGAGMIEIDVVQCKTGELVVYGERDLEEVTDGAGPVKEATFDYLRGLSVYAPKKFGDKFRGRCRIPTFEEALAAIPEGGPYINCDARNATVEIAKAIKKAGRLKQAFIAMNTPEIARVRAAVPEIMTCNMSRPATPRKVWTREEHMRYAQETVKHGCQFVQYVGVSNVPPADVVKYCHDHGVKVSYGKSDSPDEQDRIFAENGVDFLFTDRLPAQAPGSNLVPNGSFEEQRNGVAHGWKCVNGFVFLKDGGRDGFGCAAVTNHNVAKPSYIVRDFRIKGGRSYEISAWIKGEGLKGEKGGARPYAEVKDKNGKYIDRFGIYPRGALGTCGWTRYSGVINAPFEAVTISLGVMLFAGVEGKAWAVDVECVQLPEKPVRALSMNAYRNVTEPETVDMAAVLGLERGPAGEFSGLFRVLRADGKQVRAFAADSLTDDEALVSVDLSGFEPGLYRVEFVLKDGTGRVRGREECPLEVVARLPKRKVWLDKNHRTIVDGKPFFPLGMYSYDIKEPDVKLYVEAPFNCIMSYRVPTTDQMDVFEKHGIRAIVGFSNYFYGLNKKFKTLEDEIEFVKEAVYRLKGHSAMLAWYLHDELPPAFIPRLEERQRMVHELDAEHPTWAVTDQPQNMELELNTFDICGNDPYPVYNDKKADLSVSWRWARTAMSQTRGTRAVWQVPQAFTWANYQKSAPERASSRLPTYDEMRTMAYQQIAGGANGLLFYSFHDVNKTRRDEPEKWPGYWGDVKRIAGEIRRYESVWLGDPSDGVDFSGDGCKLCSVRSWRVVGANYTLIASGAAKPVRLSLALKGGGSSLTPIFGPAPTAKESGNGFDLELEPFGIAFLCF